MQALIDRYLTDAVVEDAGILDPSRVRQFLGGYRNDQETVSLVRKDKLVNHLLCLHALHVHLVKAVSTEGAQYCFVSC